VIETIYSNENGEAGRSNKVQTPFKMPKNIRQVGKSNATKKIYVEDYVMSFIKQLAGGEYSGYKVAVMVGTCIRLESCRNIFISGAVEVKDIESNSEINFTNDTWTAIYEDIKKYFVDAEIVGWFVGGPGYLLEDDDKIQKLHVDNFAGQDKVLLTYDNMEKEEAFFSYENNRLSKQDGYYIYYEKNEEMQTYMIERKSEESSEASYDDRVSRDIRTVLQSKKQPEEDSRSLTRLMYAAGTLLAVIILVVGAAMLSNYDQMKSMQNTMDYLSQNMEEIQAMFAENGSSQSSDTVTNDTAAEETAASKDQSVNIEVVPGDVQPTEDTTGQTDNGNNGVEDNNQNNSSTDEELAQATVKPSDQQAATATEGTNSVQNEVKYYTVQTGDTLADISYKLYKTYTKVNKIMALNNIEDQDLIYVGQKLIVP